MLYCKCSMTLHQHHDIILISLPSECERLLTQNKPAHGTAWPENTCARAYFVRAGQRREKSNGNYFFSFSLYFQDLIKNQEPTCQRQLGFYQSPQSKPTIYFNFFQTLPRRTTITYTRRGYITDQPFACRPAVYYSKNRIKATTRSNNHLDYFEVSN